MNLRDRLFRTLTLLVLFALMGCSKSETHLQMVAPRLAVDLEIAKVLVDMLGDRSAVTLSLTAPADQQMSSIDALSAGLADLALVSNVEPFREGTVAVMPLYSTVLHILHRPELSGMALAELLAGHSVYAGPPASPSRKLLEQTAASLNLMNEDLNLLNDERCADVVVVFAPIQQDLSARFEGCEGTYVLFSLGKPEEIGKGTRIDAITLLNPKLRPFVIPASTYGDMTPEAVVTLSVEKLLVARKELPDHVVYDLIGEVLRLKPALSALHPGLFQQLDGNFNPAASTFALHPGAQAFLQRDEPDIYERYSGVAEVAVTLLMAFVSGLYAIARIYGRRRKNRIDEFYSRAIEIRNRGKCGESPTEVSEAIVELKRLQDEGFEGLVDEKLAANESFRIFLTLVESSVIELENRCTEIRANLI